jgi:hypothetical protein
MGLNALLQALHEDCTYTILDLGPALGANVEFWSRFARKMHLGDFYASLTAQLGGKMEEGTWDASVLERLLPFTPETRWDIILCWDVLNYLTHDQVSSLLAYLSGFCKPGTLLFAQFWLSPQIPARPITFKIIGSEYLEYLGRESETRPWAFYQPRDINRFMGGFQVANSFLLRHGIQEYLFIYQGPEHETAR